METLETESMVGLISYSYMRAAVDYWRGAGGAGVVLVGAQRTLRVLGGAGRLVSSSFS